MHYSCNLCLCSFMFMLVYEFLDSCNKFAATRKHSLCFNRLHLTEHKGKLPKHIVSQKVINNMRKTVVQVTKAVKTYLSSVYVGGRMHSNGHVICKDQGLSHTNDQWSFFCLLVLHATPDSLGLDNWGRWHRCWRSDLIVEWRNLVTGEKLYWS